MGKSSVVHKLPTPEDKVAALIKQLKELQDENGVEIQAALFDAGLISKGKPTKTDYDKFANTYGELKAVQEAFETLKESVSEHQDEFDAIAKRTPIDYPADPKDKNVSKDTMGALWISKALKLPEYLTAIWLENSTAFKAVPGKGRASYKKA